MKKLLRVVFGGISAAALAMLALRLYTTSKYRAQIYSVAEAPGERIAIVFGAGLWRNGAPTPVLYDRVATAAELYQQGKVEKLLLSGDNRFVDYDEPTAMQQVALDLGVPGTALVLDYAGRSTYDTCYRAQAIFGVNRAILVTQTFHLSRALLICEALGIQAIGVNADRRPYPRRAVTFWSIREIFATANAWVAVNITHPLPILGEPLPIP